jgi:cobalamin synthase
MSSFLLALRFLTIIPLGRGQEINSASVAAAGKYYPLVVFSRAGFGFFSGSIFFPPFHGLVALLVLSRAHLDGLADCLTAFTARPIRRTTSHYEGCLWGTMGSLG